MFSSMSSDIWAPIAQRDDELRQEIRRDRVNDAETQAMAAFALLGHDLDARRLVERAPRLRHDLGADFGQLDTALAALEHAHAELCSMFLIAADKLGWLTNERWRRGRSAARRRRRSGI